MSKNRYKVISNISAIKEMNGLVITEGSPEVRIIDNGEIVFEQRFDAFFPLCISVDPIQICILAYPYLHSVDIYSWKIVKTQALPEGYGLSLTFNEKYLLTKRNPNKSRDLVLYSNITGEYIWKQEQFDLLTIINIGGILVITGWIKKNILTTLNADTGSMVWQKHFLEGEQIMSVSCYSGILIAQVSSGIIYNLDLFNGKTIWKKSAQIGVFDNKKGLIYILSSEYLVLDAITGNEVIKVENWLSNQIQQYPALQFAQTGTFLSEEYLVFASRTMDDPNEGGIFFIDKTTAEVKEYFRIVFDKDPFQRKDWYGNKIPDDQQIPFMPLETPIYKDGRLYVVLPSAIDGQKDLYIYEREE